MPPLPPLSDQFGPFDGTWINTAHQGALPRAAVAAAHQALSWKISPNRLLEDSFDTVIGRLKQALGRLLNTPAEDIILGNSASYGMHLFANGIPWRDGDEVLLVDGDFPATIFAWLPLARRGVTARFIEPDGQMVTADDVGAALTPRTRLFCTNWVHSFSGCVVDLEAIGGLCRERGVVFVLNLSQGLGARPLDLAAASVDAVTGCGHKWLCGPYGTGYCWLRPELRESLEYDQAYWSAHQSGARLSDLRDYTLRDDLGAAQYDVFGTANYNNFMPCTASIETLLDIGPEVVAAHDQALVARLIAGLDESKYEVLSPREGPERSTLVIVSHRDAARNREIREALAADGVFIALREGNLRLSPHLYNGADDIDRAIAALNAQ